jgi:tetratricopeptide (TPR) repeat protein
MRSTRKAAAAGRDHLREKFEIHPDTVYTRRLHERLRAACATILHVLKGYFMTCVRIIPLLLLLTLLTTGFDWGFGSKDKCGEARALLHGLAAKNPVEQKKDESRIRELCPDGAAVHVLQARQLELDGKQDEAVTEYRIALKIDPVLPEASRSLGLIYLQKGQTDEAAVELTKGLADGSDARSQRALAPLCRRPQVLSR